MDVELRLLLSRTLCTDHLAGKSGPALRQLLRVATVDFLTEAERQAATVEPLYMQDPRPDATATGAAAAPDPAAPVCWLSAQLVNEDTLEDALAAADVPTLCALKGVSLAWRARARRVLCARLCSRVGLPLRSNLVEVTELNLSNSRAAGRLFADAADASRALPNLATVTGLSGFEVDVTALRRVASPDGLEEDGEEDEGWWPGTPYPMAGVRACIRGEGEATMEVLLVACALRDGEACVPPNAFRGDASMTSIALPAGLASIGEGAFVGCSSLTSIELPAGLTSIGKGAFAHCSLLTSIELPAGLTSVGVGAFEFCSSLTTIELPVGLTSLGGVAFEDCTSLTSITLPAGLTSLGNRTFCGCSLLTSVELPASLTSLGGVAFDGCTSLTSITLPAGLTSLGIRTFCGCSLLTSVELPASLTSLGAFAFDGCSALTSIALPAGVTYIGNHAFDGCSSLRTIELPAGLKILGNRAFDGCSSLYLITLPARFSLRMSDLTGVPHDTILRSCPCDAPAAV